MSAFTALAWTGFTEARRNRVTVVVAAFALVVLLCTTLVQDVTINTFARVITDFGLGSMSLLLTFLAIFLSCGLLTKEIERRTIFLTVSKPVSRAEFLVARLVGNMLTLGVLLLAMYAIFVFEVKLYREQLTEPQVAAAAGLWFELWVLSSIGFLMSTFSSQTVSALVTVGAYFAGHLSGDIYNLATHSKNPVLSAFGKAVYYLIPNLERVNFRPMASYNIHVPLSTFASGAGYSLCCALVFTVLSILVFNRRDFR
jgi:ABC-type transport system involved in multi-copper enzyme maturation permease subunit